MSVVASAPIAPPCGNVFRHHKAGSPMPRTSNILHDAKTTDDATITKCPCVAPNTHITDNNTFCFESHDPTTTGVHRRKSGQASAP
jgi:hypothetical protein